MKQRQRKVHMPIFSIHLCREAQLLKRRHESGLVGYPSDWLISLRQSVSVRVSKQDDAHRGRLCRLCSFAR